MLTPFLRQVNSKPQAMPWRFPIVLYLWLNQAASFLMASHPEAFKGKDSSSSLFNRDLTNVLLPSSMQALEPFKDQLSIVQGLSGKMCRGGHSSWFGMMGVYMTGGEFDAGAVIRATADAELAKLNPAPLQSRGTGD